MSIPLELKSYTVLGSCRFEAGFGSDEPDTTGATAAIAAACGLLGLAVRLLAAFWVDKRRRKHSSAEGSVVSGPEPDDHAVMRHGLSATTSEKGGGIVRNSKVHHELDASSPNTRGNAVETAVMRHELDA